LTFFRRIGRGGDIITVSVYVFRVFIAIVQISFQVFIVLLE
jgi:hypothetical protein